MINTIIICATLSILLVYGLHIFQRLFFLNKYKMVIELLTVFMEKSYTTIYSDQLVTYTGSGITKIQKDEIETIERNFIKLTIELLGEFNAKLLSDFYGDKQTLIKNILIYFRQKLERDELAKLINIKIPT